MSPPTTVVRRYNQLELITEHLGYLPVRFTDDFYNACIGCMAKAVEGVEAFVSTLPGDERKKMEGVEKFDTLLDNAFDKRFVVFEEFVFNNIFRLPENLPITLSHNKGLNFTYTQAYEDHLDKELEELRKSVIAQKALQFKLKNQIKSTERLTQRLESCQKEMGFLTTIPKQNGLTQIGDTIDLVSNQLQTLQNLMVPLQEFMADPEKMALVAKEDQRTQYIKRDVQRQLRMYTEADLEDEAYHNLVRQELSEKTSQIASLADLQALKELYL
ncbi:Mis12 protein-domain-containing protein [Umbelopsis sp. AD052]|nr:Mis12 protein-domain-containing protein [Umbelopsis sp. AD052]